MAAVPELPTPDPLRTEIEALYGFALGSPQEIAHRLWNRHGRDFVQLMDEEAVRALLVDLARYECKRIERNVLASAPLQYGGMQEASRSRGSRIGRSWLDIAVIVPASGEPHGASIWIGDVTAQQWRLIADAKRTMAEAVEAKANVAAQIAETISRARGASCIRDLNEDKQNHIRSLLAGVDL